MENKGWHRLEPVVNVISIIVIIIIISTSPHPSVGMPFLYC